VLDQIFGGELPTAVRFVIAFGVVLSLIALTFVGLRRFAGRRLPLSNGAGRARQPRLGVLDAFAIDARRRLVLIRRDNVEHLIMIGGPNDVLVESEIVRAPAQAALAPQRNGQQQRPAEAARAPAAPQAQTPSPQEVPAPQIPAPQRPLLVPEQTAANLTPELPEPRAPGFRSTFQRPAPAAVPAPPKAPERPQAARPPMREQQPQVQVQRAEDGPVPAKPKVEIDPLYADIEKKLGEALARPASPQPQRAAPPPPTRSAPPPPARRAPEPAAAAPPAASTPKSHLDALEEEMASLLGRDRS
jgi:flagellar protein FliO/FliZ